MVELADEMRWSVRYLNVARADVLRARVGTELAQSKIGSE